MVHTIYYNTKTGKMYEVGFEGKTINKTLRDIQALINLNEEVILRPEEIKRRSKNANL